jgi:hypothetical protein
VRVVVIRCAMILARVPVTVVIAGVSLRGVVMAAAPGIGMALAPLLLEA